MATLSWGIIPLEPGRLSVFVKILAGYENLNNEAGTTRTQVHLIAWLLINEQIDTKSNRQRMDHYGKAG